MKAPLTASIRHWKGGERFRVANAASVLEVEPVVSISSGSSSGAVPSGWQSVKVFIDQPLGSEPKVKTWV